MKALALWTGQLLMAVGGCLLAAGIVAVIYAWSLEKLIAAFRLRNTVVNWCHDYKKRTGKYPWHRPNVTPDRTATR